MQKTLVPVAVGLLITVLTGIVYGRLCQRWGPNDDLKKAAQHLATFPKEFGDWQLVSDDPMSAFVIKTLSCAGYVNRQYVNQRTGETVSIAITAGPSGPISVHSPEICYSSNAYTVADERSEIMLTDENQREHAFWSVAFNPKIASGDQLRVIYAWSDGSQWTAPANPRFAFAGRPSLHKLQLSTLVPKSESEASQDPGKRFLADLLKSGWTVAK